MNKGFDDDGFMQYLADEFGPMDNHFTHDLVENIIQYAHEHEHVSKDQFVDFLVAMIPEVEFKEVAAFADDDILTSWGIQMKQQGLAKIG